MKQSLFIFPLLSVFTAFSQSDSILTENKLNEVIISATKTNQTVNELPIPITIISEKEVQEFSASKLYDVITKQTGIVSVTTKTGTEGLQMQGLDASYTTFLIDGFPIIGRSFGTLDLNRISVADIERIEVVKGPSSSLYGSNALGGVINLISKKQIDDGPIISTSLKHATYNSTNSSLVYKYKEGTFQISNSFDYYKTDGYDLIDTDLLSTVNPYSNYTFRSNFKYALSDKLLLNTNGHYYKQEQINIAADSSYLLKGESNIKEWSFGASAKYLMNANFNQQLEIYKTNYRADEFLNTEGGVLYEDNYFDHTLLQSEMKSSFTYKGVNSIVGFGITKEELSRRDFSNNPEQDLKFIYGQLDATAFNKVNIILGSRYDNYTNYTPVVSNKLALGFPLTNKIQINGSVGTGFKTPDFRQKYFDFTNSTIGYIVLGRDVAIDRLDAMQNIQEVVPFSELSSPLKSETSLNINIGLKYNPTDNLSFDVNLFNNKVNDLIEWKLVAKDENNINIYSYFNVNQVETKGLEFNTTYKKVNDWEIKFGYQLLYAYDTEVKRRFEEETIYARDQETNVSFKLNKDDYFGLFNRSRHMGNIKFNYHLNNKTEMNAMLTYRSKYALSDSNANGFLDTYDQFIEGYSLCDLGISHQISSLKSCQIGVKNIFGFTNPEYISNISGRLYYMNFKINFK
ncbi:MAG: TonB-dependent receptor [Flavobacteriales bacterium]|nr:TonB-dependent receptor [Flavobacteriales bacterium]